MGLFFTGRGDRGKSTVGSVKVDKASPIMDALGDLDELNSFLGLLCCQKILGRYKKDLLRIQEDLFIIQANIAAPIYKNLYKTPNLAGDKVIVLNSRINSIEKKVKPKRSFVIPGSNQASAWLDYARALARRAERSTLKINKKNQIDPDILAYLNRLSSFIFALAREAAFIAEKQEQRPSYK